MDDSDPGIAMVKNLVDGAIDLQAGVFPAFAIMGNVDLQQTTGRTGRNRAPTLSAVGVNSGAYWEVAVRAGGHGGRIFETWKGVPQALSGKGDAETIPCRAPDPLQNPPAGSSSTQKTSSNPLKSVLLRVWVPFPSSP